MAIPDFQTLMLPVLRTSSGGEVHIGDVVDRLADEFELSDEERIELLPSGRQATFANRVHWAKSYLGKAALIEMTGRGRFKIADRGSDVLKSPPDRITIKYLEKFPEFLSFRKFEGIEKQKPLSSEAVDPQKATPDEIIRTAYGELERELGSELLQRIQKAPPAFFENLIVRLLVSMGYGGTTAKVGKALTLGKSGDGGVDGVIDQDHLGLDRVYVQAKRYADENIVGPGAVRDFFGALDAFKAAKGLFVTTSEFSASARQTAENLSKRIVLINGRQLAELMIRFDVGCRVEETIHLKRIDEEFFD